MGKSEIIAIWLGVLVIVCMSLFSPWMETLTPKRQSYFNQTTTFIGWRGMLIEKPKDGRPIGTVVERNDLYFITYHVHAGLLSFQIVIVSLLTAVIVLTARWHRSRPTSNSGKSISAKPPTPPPLPPSFDASRLNQSDAASMPTPPPTDSSHSHQSDAATGLKSDQQEARQEPTSSTQEMRKTIDIPANRNLRSLVYYLVGVFVLCALALWFVPDVQVPTANEDNEVTGSKAIDEERLQELEKLIWERREQKAREGTTVH